MLTNAQMTENRFGRWARARKMVKAIVSHLEAGNTVVISTYTSHVKYSKRHAGMFKAAKNGAFVQAGKRWDCIDHCAIKVYG